MVTIATRPLAPRARCASRPRSGCDLMHVRDATPEDLPAITRMIEALAAHEHCEIFNVPNDIVFVAERGGRVIGMVSVFPPLAGLPKAQINNLWVDVEHRRHGIATRLVNAAERFVCQYYDDAEVVFNVDDSNAEGVAFWTALGFAKEAAA